MQTGGDIFQGICAAVIFYAAFPFVIALGCGLYTRRFRKTGEVFDFFADILYPWRWKRLREKIRRGKRKR